MQKLLNSLSLIVVCGSAMTGKTTTARYLGKELNTHVLDIDDLRNVCFGMPPMLPTAESHKLHMIQFGASYRVLFIAIEQQLSVIKDSLIITASISSYEQGQVLLMEIAMRAGARLKVIWLKANPSALSDEDLNLRIKERLNKQLDYTGTLGTIHGVEFFRERHQQLDIRIPGLICIETWPNNSPEITCTKALAY